MLCSYVQGKLYRVICFAMETVQVSGEVVMVSLHLDPDGMSSDENQGVEWMLFAFAYTLVAMRIGVRLARQQQKHIIVSDVFLIISALCLLGLITCESVPSSAA
jgi:hypothetical protein